MDTRDALNLVERVATIAAYDVRPTDSPNYDLLPEQYFAALDSSTQQKFLGMATAIVDDLGLADVAGWLIRIIRISREPHPNSDTRGDLLRDLRHIDAQARAALAKLTGEDAP